MPKDLKRTMCNGIPAWGRGQFYDVQAAHWCHLTTGGQRIYVGDLKGYCCQLWTCGGCGCYTCYDFYCNLDHLVAEHNSQIRRIAHRNYDEIFKNRMPPGVPLTAPSGFVLSPPSQFNQGPPPQFGYPQGPPGDMGRQGSLRAQSGSFNGPPGNFNGPPQSGNFNGPPGPFNGPPGPFNGPPQSGNFNTPPGNFIGPPPGQFPPQDGNSQDQVNDSKFSSEYNR
ncbi:MAG: hypothetical protein EZS28_051963 [Streblomastix strix]|uniref:Uncharacterized protein n=1 Tax=Streblomastix strix TaxID=222440 RepID=A0A5J4SSG4_9EUKA|nr:MAG: hypothetical protein EZS28_051963 [Streblomastix strix]